MKPEVVFGLENAAWPALLVGVNGNVLLTNTAAKAVFGAILSGSPAQLAAVWAPENGGGPADFLARWEKSPTATGVLKFRIANGTTVPFSTAICQFTGDGQRLFALQLLPSVAAPAPVVEAPAAPVGDAALKQKLDCVLQLARTVSLDFNNALTGVLAHTSLLLGKAEPEHPWRRSLLEVEKSAARAAEIAGELAQFSRQEKEVRRAPVGNLNAVMLRCVDFFQNTHGTRFTWKLTPERSLFAARFDEAKVQQALTKILENAIESFIVGGGGQIAVETRNVELTEATQDRNVRLNAGTYVCVEISDGGAGIDAEALPRIFEPFFTTKRAPHRGLGLALVYGIITNHGGGIAISSQPGQGTSARVYLPAEKSLVDETGGSPKEMHGTGTVLVVDDEGLVLTMAETILTDFGYKVLTASGGQKALTILGQPESKVNLVITDLVMPGMGGRELAERIRQLNPHLPVMSTSGYVLPEEKKAGAGFLQKPFTSSELLRKVKSALTPADG
ncbi:MAG TPA: ATP-binding protein [Verrucomicrobiae bacterium]|jgi:signal transduction histidine kinase